MEKKYKIELTITDTEADTSYSAITDSKELNKIDIYGVDGLHAMYTNCINQIELLVTPKLLSEDEINLTRLKDTCQRYVGDLERGITDNSSYHEKSIIFDVINSLYGRESLAWFKNKNK